MSSCHYTSEGNEIVGKLKYQAKFGKIHTFWCRKHSGG